MSNDVSKSTLYFKLANGIDVLVDLLQHSPYEDPAEMRTEIADFVSKNKKSIVTALLLASHIEYQYENGAIDNG